MRGGGGEAEACEAEVAPSTARRRAEVPEAQPASFASRYCRALRGVEAEVPEAAASTASRALCRSFEEGELWWSDVQCRRGLGSVTCEN